MHQASIVAQQALALVAEDARLSTQAVADRLGVTKAVVLGALHRTGLDQDFRALRGRWINTPTVPQDRTNCRPPPRPRRRTDVPPSSHPWRKGKGFSAPASARVDELVALAAAAVAAGHPVTRCRTVHAWGSTCGELASLHFC